MILAIANYGHPVLRQKGKRVDKVTDEIRRLAADMLETMHDANGVGLAAQQVGEPLMLTVIDISPAEQPSTMEVNGKTVDPTQFMPLALLNPVVTNPSGEQVGPEGCLSIPEVSADITRAAEVDVEALTLDGKKIKFRCGGLLARAAQHEVDHLNGILFIDRMDAATRAGFSGQLKRLQKETEAALPIKKSKKTAV